MTKINDSATQMTREEYQSLKAELDQLKTVERVNISEKIRVARSFGDLSENSEYDEAKNDQARLEAQISRLEEQIKNVTIVEQIDTGAVAVGTKVKLLDLEYNDETEYRISSSVTTGDQMPIITLDSPVGKAIFGKKIGDVVDVETPSKKTYQIKILDISK